MPTLAAGQVVAQRAVFASVGRRITRTAAARLRRLRPDVSRGDRGHEPRQTAPDFRHGVSYLSYPDFETDPHPALMRSVKLNLRTRELDCWDYFDSNNPPILHRKETFLPADHPLREKFARLTRQEEQHGLLDETATIGTRNGWNSRLQDRGFTLRGHRLVRRRAVGQPTDLP